jgi:hypothetical protein
MVLLILVGMLMALTDPGEPVMARVLTPPHGIFTTLQYLAICTALVLITGSAAAQPLTAGPKSQPTAQRKPVAQAFYSQPFDSALAALPPNFVGHSCNAIASRLKPANVAKDTYETTETYNRRIEQLGSLKLYDAVTVSDTLSFVSEPLVTPRDGVMASAYLQQKYYADSEILQVELTYTRSSTKSAFRDDMRRAAVIVKRSTKESSYLASNAFGKTVRVDRTVFDVCGLVFIYRGERDPGSVTVEFKVGPDEARSLQVELAAAYVGNLSPPYYSVFDYSPLIPPTIDRPYIFQ